MEDDKPLVFYGPKRRAPRYYIGETFGHEKIIKHYYPRPTVPPDCERHLNGAQSGIRDKAARRVIRLAFKKSTSRNEQRFLKALELRREVEQMAGNSHEKKRYLEMVLKQHVPILQPTTRSQDRAATRKERMKARRAERRSNAA